ncbi:hypothetical protein CFP56_034793 [Quercus suber]|uniref:Uncharacterized protein n=1 Tax=Quercus suber TaxID=58331 RepID=A0AAW0LTH7_QUESU
MNLNCLSRKFMHGNKSDSDCGEHDRDKSGRKIFNLKAEGISWSGYLYIPMSIPPPYKKMRSNTTTSTKMKVKTGHCQKHKSGPLEFKSSNDEPRLPFPGPVPTLPFSVLQATSCNVKMASSSALYLIHGLHHKVI